MSGLPSLSVIGLGKVGETLARLFYQHGYRIAAVSSRSADRAAAVANMVHADVRDPLGAVNAADLTLLTVPDDVIASVANRIADGGVIADRRIVHTSGVLDARALDDLQQRGAVVGSFHPAYPFADVESALNGLPGSAFAVEAEDERLRGWLIEMAAALNGVVMVIPPGGKVLYHAALVITSNYMVTLYAVARDLLTGIGADSAAAEQALNALVSGTAANLGVVGVPAALTGPLVRGDVGTIRAHLAALDAANPAAAALYRQLARATLPLVSARGKSTQEMEHLF